MCCCSLCPYVEVIFNHHAYILPLKLSLCEDAKHKLQMLQSMQTHAHTCVRLCVQVCLCARAVPLCCWWLGFRIVSRLSVINVPRRVGPERYITNRRGGRVHRGKEEDGASGGERGAEWEKKRRRGERRWGRKGEDRLVRKKRKGGRGCFLLGPAMFPIM